MVFRHHFRAKVDKISDSLVHTQLSSKHHIQILLEMKVRLFMSGRASPRAIHWLIYYTTYVHYPLSTCIDISRSSSTESTSKVQSSNLNSPSRPLIPTVVIGLQSLIPFNHIHLRRYPLRCYGCCLPRKVSSHLWRHCPSSEAQSSLQSRVALPLMASPRRR